MMRAGKQGWCSPSRLVVTVSVLAAVAASALVSALLFPAFAGMKITPYMAWRTSIAMALTMAAFGCAGCFWRDLNASQARPTKRRRRQVTMVAIYVCLAALLAWPMAAESFIGNKAILDRGFTSRFIARARGGPELFQGSTVTKQGVRYTIQE